MQDYSKLYQYIDDHAEEYIALLQQFCRQPAFPHKTWACGKWLS